MRPDEEPYVLTDTDRLLLCASREDARVGYAPLGGGHRHGDGGQWARRTPCARRVVVDVDVALLGVTVSAPLWTQVAPDAEAPHACLTRRLAWDAVARIETAPVLARAGRQPMPRTP
ncbi:hypothetical protein [Streptomyces sp. NPDC046862]|uniref:hypothetical protein n=1 Tax=Streptomyces sp. NPDC046862 TaxID=3154603 RepID=UPI003456EDD6